MTFNLDKNPDKTKSVRKGFIYPKVRFLTIGSFLLGIQSGCRTTGPKLRQLLTESIKQQNQAIPLITASATQPGQGNTELSGGDSLLSDNVSDHLGAVMCLKKSRHVGFIKVDQKSKAKTTQSALGLLFYADNDLTNCSKMHLTKEGITWEDNDTKEKHIRKVMVVEGKMFELLCKEAEPLEDTNQNRIQITHAADVMISHLLGDSLVDTMNLQKMQDGEKVVFCGRVNGIQLKDSKEVKEAVVAFAKDSCDLDNLVRSILCGSDKETSAKDCKIYPAIVSENLFVFVDGGCDRDLDFVGHTAYCYLKEGDYYRLICLNNVEASVSDKSRSHQGIFWDVVGLSPEIPKQVVPPQLTEPSQMPLETLVPEVLPPIQPGRQSQTLPQPSVSSGTVQFPSPPPPPPPPPLLLNFNSVVSGQTGNGLASGQSASSPESSKKSDDGQQNQSSGGAGLDEELRNRIQKRSRDKEAMEKMKKAIEDVDKRVPGGQQKNSGMTEVLMGSPVFLKAIKDRDELPGGQQKNSGITEALRKDEKFCKRRKANDDDSADDSADE